jgi:hypothetical protein
VGAVFIGKALAGIRERAAAARRPVFRRLAPAAIALALLLISWQSYGYAASLFEASAYYDAQLEIGRRVDAAIPRDALLIVGDLDDDARGSIYRSQNPVLLYYCHRKGWQLMPEQLDDAPLVRSLLADGNRYVLRPDRLLDDGPRTWVTMTLFDASGRKLAYYDFPPSRADR